jgi:hypothetical protein
VITDPLRPLHSSIQLSKRSLMEACFVSLALVSSPASLLSHRAHLALSDMPVLAGNYPETCFAKYGTMSLKSGYHSEMALRSLFAPSLSLSLSVSHSISSIGFFFTQSMPQPTSTRSTSSHGCLVSTRSSLPSTTLLSALPVSVDFYVRIFVRVFTVCPPLSLSLSHSHSSHWLSSRHLLFIVCG